MIFQKMQGAKITIGNMLAIYLNSDIHIAVFSGVTTGVAIPGRLLGRRA